MYLVDIVDDSPMFTTGTANYLSSVNHNIKIGVMAHSAHEYLSYLKTHKHHQPTVAIIDYRMPGLLGWHLSLILEQAYPQIHKIGISADTLPQWISNFIASGCKTFVSKDESIEMLNTAISCVAQGNYFYNHYFTKEMQVPVCTQPDFPFGLNNQEYYYIQLCQTNLTDKAIASLLNIQPNAEHNIQKKIFKRFNVKNRAQLVQNAMQKKIIKYSVFAE